MRAFSLSVSFVLLALSPDAFAGLVPAEAAPPALAYVQPGASLASGAGLSWSMIAGGCLALWVASSTALGGLWALCGLVLGGRRRQGTSARFRVRC